MTNDSAFISEVWELMKPYIDKDSRADICDQLIGIFDAFNCTEGLEDDVGFEKILQKAINTYYDADEDDDAEEEYDE